MKNLIIAIALMFGFGLTANAQSKKAEEKAENKTEQLAMYIETGDKDVALSQDQIDKIENLYAEMRMEINNLKKQYPDKGDDFENKRKEISKKYSQMVNKDVLTKDQRKAKRKGKEMLEEQ